MISLILKIIGHFSSVVRFKKIVRSKKNDAHLYLSILILIEEFDQQRWKTIFVQLQRIREL